MEYTEIHTGPWGDEPDPWWAKILKRILPAANPDFEDQLYPLTRTWWIELDDNRIAQREIGFDETGNAIVLGPVGQNYGFAVDSPGSWPATYEHCDEAARKFDEVWSKLWPTFAHLEEHQSQQAGSSNGGNALV